MPEFKTPCAFTPSTSPEPEAGTVLYLVEGIGIWVLGYAATAIITGARSRPHPGTTRTLVPRFRESSTPLPHPVARRESFSVVVLTPQN